MPSRTHLLDNTDLKPSLDEQMETLWSWLEDQGFTAQGHTMDVPLGQPDSDDGKCYSGERVAIAQSTSRQPISRFTQKELKAIKQQYANHEPEGTDKEKLWAAQKTPNVTVRHLEWQRLPADAMAFYRPFHYPPYDQWGIYLLAGPLVNYHQQLQKISADLKLWSPEVLMHLVVFEIFNHEFFHHLAESTATNLEILLAASGNPSSIYLNYRKNQRENMFDDPHAPLEEALANAYAYNSLSFISRIKAGYKTAIIKAYQAAIQKHWKLEPAGYKEAGFYIDGDYIAGGARLLEQLIAVPGSANSTPLSSVAKHVMPNGHTALMAKPDIPTYLVGSVDEITAFNKLVPAINEAYTRLFWPYNTKPVDEYFQKQKEKEKAAKKAANINPQEELWPKDTR